MAYVITRLCRDCVDGSCIPVCPVDDTIVQHRPKDRISELPNQLVINPDTCIDCGCCVPECPWEAIVHEDDVPELFRDDIALNALTTAKPDEFVAASIRTSRKPTSEEIEANKQRWKNAAEGCGDPR
jgi:ferredoxin